MPFDQHMLLALIAPRKIYTTSRTFDSWADPEGQFESCIQADPVYQLLGETGMPARKKPLPEHPIHEGCIAHHQKTGKAEAKSASAHQDSQLCGFTAAAGAMDFDISMFGEACQHISYFSFRKGYSLF